MTGWRIPGLAARPRFTSRATVLVLVLCSLVAILAYPTKQFISQRSEIAAQRERAEHARQQVEQLRREKARWQDPEYVRTQARERLHYAMPGETPFTAADPSATPAPGSPAAGSQGGAVARGSIAQGPAGTAPNGAPGAPGRAARPWYTDLWRSVDAADRAVDAAAQAPPAAVRPPAAVPAPPPPAAPAPSAPVPTPAPVGDSSSHDH